LKALVFAVVHAGASSFDLRWLKLVNVMVNASRSVQNFCIMLFIES